MFCFPCCDYIIALFIVLVNWHFQQCLQCSIVHIWHCKQCLFCAILR
nr:MAG TPA: hypothetical protein [Caudoviricetes sp.]